MSTIYFDTHQFVTELKQVGMPEAQAETIIRLQQQAIAATLEQAKHDYSLDELATKRDLKELEVKLEAKIEGIRADLKRDIEVLRAETKQGMAETKAELIRWVVAAGLLQTALITGVLLKVAHLI